MGGCGPFTARRRMSSNRPASMTTSSSTVRPSSPSRSTTPPAAWIFVAPRVASTGCSSVLPFVPSTIEWNRVSSGMPLPTSASANAGMLVVPSTSMRSSTPLNDSGRIQDSGNPVEDAKVRVLETVRRRQRGLGRLVGLPGPECPFRLDAARRRWIGEVRAERPRVVRADILHVELPDLEHARRFARLPSKDSQHGPLRLQIADDEGGLLAVVVVGVIGLVVVQAHAAGWDVDLQALQTDVAHRDRIAEESHEAGFARE